jgi:hypothetical protein
MKTKTAVCADCGTKFVKATITSKCCSQNCKTRYWEKNQDELEPRDRFYDR